MIKVVTKNQMDKYLDEIVDLRIKLNDIHVDSLKDVFKDNIMNETRLDTIYAINDTNRDVVIMENNDVVMAYALINYEKTKETFDKKAKEVYYIQEIMISNAFQNQGLGKKMIEYLKKDAYKKGFKLIELDVWSFNQKAISFYKNVGLNKNKLQEIKASITNDYELFKKKSNILSILRGISFLLIALSILLYFTIDLHFVFIILTIICFIVLLIIHNHIDLIKKYYESYLH